MRLIILIQIIRLSRSAAGVNKLIKGLLVSVAEHCANILKHAPVRELRMQRFYLTRNLNEKIEPLHSQLTTLFSRSHIFPCISMECRTRCYEALPISQIDFIWNIVTFLLFFFLSAYLSNVYSYWVDISIKFVYKYQRVATPSFSLSSDPLH